MEATGGSRLEVQDALDREVELVASAIDLVAAHGASSATVAGLRLMDQVIEIVRRRATERGVVLEPLWSADESTSDVRVVLARGA